jgi:glyoxylase I family protein
VTVERFSHVGVCVTNLERSLSFYRDLLGFRTVAEGRYRGNPVDALLDLEGVDLHAVWLERDGTRIELLAFAAPAPGSDAAAEPARPMNRPGLTHLSFRVRDLAATVARLRASQVRVLDASRFDAPEHGLAAVFLLDPDGTRIELVQSPGDPGAPPAS